MGHLCSDNSQLDGRQTGLPPAIYIGLSSNIYLFQGIEEQARSQDLPRGGGGSYLGEKWTLSLGGSHIGKNVDLCIIPYRYGAFGPRGPPRPPLATGL